MNTLAFFSKILSNQKSDGDMGICSVCCSNEIVLEAAMEHASDTRSVLLVEATANQVNQFGGYTGMRPIDFVSYIEHIAKRVGFDTGKLILGGDHLGPLVWADKPEESAMSKAETLVAAFTKAGFKKIHLDTSMPLGDDPAGVVLSDDIIARRTARLCVAAEQNADPNDPPIYVLGSEVPTPGGAAEDEDALQPTQPQSLKNAFGAFERVFMTNSGYDLTNAFKRVIGFVVQPGVEFANNSIIQYDPVKAAELIAYAKTLPNILLEGHSTDYQTKAALARMRKDGIAIQKVGPALTFALREALFSAEAMERALYPIPPEGGYSDFGQELVNSMFANPKPWAKYYTGTVQEQIFACKFSLSDRSRYYFDQPAVKAAIAKLFKNLEHHRFTFGLIAQYFSSEKEMVFSNNAQPAIAWLVKEHIKNVLRTYTNSL